MLPLRGSICGKLTEYLPLGCLQGGMSLDLILLSEPTPSLAHFSHHRRQSDAPPPVQYGHREQLADRLRGLNLRRDHTAPHDPNRDLRPISGPQHL